MIHRDPWVQVTTRLGAVIGVTSYLLGGLGTALEYGSHIGQAFNQGLAGTPFAGAVFSKLLVFSGSLMGALAGLMMSIVFGALFGGVVGGGVVRYVLAPLRDREKGTAEPPGPRS